MEKLNYGEFEEEFTVYENAAIAILPVPYDGTSTWLKGADKGPKAILEASVNMEFYDIETDSEVFTHGITTLEPVTEDSSPEAMAAEVERRVNEVIDRHLPVTIEFVPKAEAKEIVDLSKLPEDASNTLRIVRIGDYDACACIGAHVNNTSEIGHFKMLTYDYTDGRLRLRFKLTE